MRIQRAIKNCPDLKESRTRMLTDEDRLRIEEEERHRAKVQQEIASSNDLRTGRSNVRGVWGVIIIILGIGAILYGVADAKTILPYFTNAQERAQTLGGPFAQQFADFQAQLVIDGVSLLAGVVMLFIGNRFIKKRMNVSKY